MGDLSPHFSRKEFECRCCGRLVLDDGLAADIRLPGLSLQRMYELALEVPQFSRGL